MTLTATFRTSPHRLLTSLRPWRSWATVFEAPRSLHRADAVAFPVEPRPLNTHLVSEESSSNSADSISYDLGEETEIEDSTESGRDQESPQEADGEDTATHEWMEAAPEDHWALSPEQEDEIEQGDS